MQRATGTHIHLRTKILYFFHQSSKLFVVSRHRGHFQMHRLSPNVQGAGTNKMPSTGDWLPQLRISILVFHSWYKSSVIKLSVSRYQTKCSSASYVMICRLCTTHIIDMRYCCASMSDSCTVGSHHLVGESLLGRVPLESMLPLCDVTWDTDSAQIPQSRPCFYHKWPLKLFFFASLWLVIGSSWFLHGSLEY